jgi:hypothetical protein
MSAQQTVEIVVHYENLSQSCVIPAQWNFYVSAEMQYYSPTDSASFFIDFGDGHDTTITNPLYFLDAIHSHSIVQGLQHIYTVQGNYPVVYIVTMPDGNADTLNFNAMATATCGNVTGRLYVDANSDCTYNSGDIPVINIPIRLDYNSTAVSIGSTDAQGLFALSACPGFTYNLLTDTSSYYSPVFNLTCSTYNGITVNPSPNATQDLIANNTSTVNIGYVPDSTYFTYGNCAPFATSLSFYGGTVGLTFPNDSIDMYFNFGDGSDTTIRTPAYGNNGPISIGNFGRNIAHTYSAAGNYDVEYIATGPGGISDTVVKLNKVSVVDTCGNVQGTIYRDNNNNCIYDAGDSADMYMYVALTYTSSGYTRYAFTDVNGHYSFDVTPGNYTVSVLPGMNNTVPLTPSCPASGMTNVVVTASNSCLADFGLICTSNHQSRGWYSIWPGIFPNYHSHINLSMNEYACMPIADTVKFILDPMVNLTGFCDSAFLPVISGDTLTWTFTSITNFQNWHYWFWNLACLEIIGNPSLQLGDTVCFTMIVSPISNDIYPADNIITRCVPALVSLDPNRKEVLPQGSGPLGYVPQQTNFEYNIEFQNTGTAMARNIFVLDTLDADLDLSTLVIIGSSHFMTPQILPGNVLKFRFDDINLADSTSDEVHSHGWVAYRISAKPALANGTPIQNTAGIYFDFNPPVITNSTLNTIFDPASVNEISVNDVMVFPNPASSSVEIKFKSAIKGKFSIADLAGNEVFNGELNGTSNSIDVRTLTPGVYMLILETEQGRSVHKIIVQH